ncbi:succinylglutamate desuccinylase/aspartoacylase family protein [Phytoactinopolyspora limicola]|uniref:succinylglutamate desuccinylase/aspartoacylase family protein n=1 Tax=Phytoactinopolyspora limicola TaxID=2715536 RepID=UPI00140B2DDC|nr:M14 family metallopeptidase [Phytoactinopolyspora limicola]
MTKWTSHRLVAPRDAGLGVTRHRLDSGRPGPRLIVLGGVHGNEIGGIVGAGRLTLQPWPLQAGLVDVISIVHEAAYAAFSRTGPADGLDLARTFPGDPAGTPTERLAALLTDEVIADADGLIDLHTSSQDADLPLFAGALGDGSAVGHASTAMATAFGFDVVWTHPTLGAGRTLTIAAERGIPAMYVESPVGGVLSEKVVSSYTTGVLRVAESWGMLPHGCAQPGPPIRLRLHGPGDTDSFVAADRDGHFVADVELLASVRTGDRLGRVLDFMGRTISEITAARDGHVVFIRRLAPVTTGTPLVAVCAALVPAAG